MALAALLVKAAWDPRGEVSVDVFRRGQRNAGRWSFNGMVGRASVERMLELAGEAMRAEPAILAADPEFYERLISCGAEEEVRGMDCILFRQRSAPTTWQAS
ncbi:MAG TPA: hypothetical protein VKU60_04705 [Chloroflexota bacterium]|nr:hypothetical protein [Chloroflexota bacterium]